MLEYGGRTSTTTHVRGLSAILVLAQSNSWEALTHKDHDKQGHNLGEEAWEHYKGNKTGIRQYTRAVWSTFA